MSAASVAVASSTVVVEQLGKPLPQNAAAEFSVVSACLVFPDAVYDVGSTLLPAHFALEQPRILWTAIHALATDGLIVDATTVSVWLREHGLLEKVGGIDGINKVRTMARDVAHVGHHGELIQRLARLRATIDEAGKIVAEGNAGPGDVSTWLDRAGHRVEHAAIGAGEPKRGSTTREVFERITAKFAAPTKQAWLSTGNKRLDRLLGGMRPGSLICVGSYSKHGKTAFSAGIVDHVACVEVVDDKRAGVAVFTLEMGEDEYTERMWATRAGVNNKLVLSPSNWDFIGTERNGKLVEAAHFLREAPIKIFDDPSVSPSIIRSELRRLASQWEREGDARLRLAVIDYAQILTADRDSERRRDSREQEVASISRTLKKIAAELKIVIILLAQLNDDGKREGRPPRASDLRESKGLFFDANAVVLVYNPSMDEDPEFAGDTDRFDVMQTVDADIIVAAVRGGGERGKVRMTYRPGCTRFEAHNGPVEPLHKPREQKQAGRSRYAPKSGGGTPNAGEQDQ